MRYQQKQITLYIKKCIPNHIVYIMYESLFGSPQERELKLKKNGFLKKNHETHYLTLIPIINIIKNY